MEKSPEFSPFEDQEDQIGTASEEVSQGDVEKSERVAKKAEKTLEQQEETVEAPKKVIETPSKVSGREAGIREETPKTQTVSPEARKMTREELQNFLRSPGVRLTSEEEKTEDKK